MSIVDMANEVLADAEQKLAKLAAEALRERDYAAAKWLSSLSEQIAAHQRKETSADATLVASPNRDVIAFVSPDIPANPAATPSDSIKQLPHFFREGEQLVKIGYSKSDRRTYEHRSPREVLDQLAEILADVGSNGQGFTTEQLLAHVGQRQSGIPSYQVYLCLAFLIRQEFVRRRGRSEYTVERAGAGELPAEVSAAWSALPLR